MTSKTEKLASSFRDPSGFLFTRDGVLYRQVNHHYQSDYEKLMQSGLYDALVKQNLLVPHQEVDIPPTESGNHGTNSLSRNNSKGYKTQHD